jgi:hypothetical protein
VHRTPEDPVAQYLHQDHKLDFSIRMKKPGYTQKSRLDL